MPAAVLIGGLIAIAFAFAAISASLLIRNLVVSPIRGAAVAVSEVAVVGGVIAWALTQLANIVEIGISGMAYLANVGEKQAADWWNYLIHETVANQFWVYFNEANLFNGMMPALQYIVGQFPGLYSLVVHSVWPTAIATADNLNKLQAFVYGEASQTINAINQDLVGLHHWIDGYELPLIRGIGNDLAGLKEWINGNVAVRSDVVNAEAQAIAAARALVVPIEAAISDIENSPCMQSCDVLGGIGQLLQGLEDAGMLAIMLALIEETRRDPNGVQSALRSVVVPIVDDAVNSTGILG